MSFLDIFYLVLYGIFGVAIGTIGQFYVWNNVERIKDPMQDIFFELLPDAGEHIDTFLVPNWISIVMYVVALFSLQRGKILQLICQFLDILFFHLFFRFQIKWIEYFLALY